MAALLLFLKFFAFILLAASIIAWLVIWLRWISGKFIPIMRTRTARLFYAVSVVPTAISFILLRQKEVSFKAHDRFFLELCIADFIGSAFIVWLQRRRITAGRPTPHDD